MKNKEKILNSRGDNFESIKELWKEMEELYPEDEMAD